MRRRAYRVDCVWQGELLEVRTVAPGEPVQAIGHTLQPVEAWPTGGLRAEGLRLVATPIQLERAWPALDFRRVLALSGLLAIAFGVCAELTPSPPVAPAPALRSATIRGCLLLRAPERPRSTPARRTGAGDALGAYAPAP